MVSLFVLAVSFVVMRLLAVVGIARLSTWQAAGRAALAVMFLFTGSMHFSSLKHDFTAMIPDPLPNGLWVVYLTGLFEMAGALGLLVPGVRKLAGGCLVLLLIVMFSANVNAAINDIPLGGDSPVPLWFRAPMQLLYIGMIWWVAIRANSQQRVKDRVARPFGRNRVAAAARAGIG